MIKRVVYLTLFFALILFYFSDVLHTGRIFAERDLPVFFYPYLHLWRTGAMAGEFTLWNPFIMCGEPLFAALQPAQVYPLSIIYYLFPLDDAFNITIILHFFLAGFFTFLLVKELKGSDSAGIIASVSFTFGGYLLSVHNVLSTLLSVTWFPLVLICFLRSLTLFSFRYALYSGVFLGVMFSAGGIEVFLFTLPIMGILTICPYLTEPPDAMSPFSKRFLLFLVSISFFLVLMAIQWIPFYELIRNSIRSEGIQFEESALWSLAPKNLMYLLIPDAFYKGFDYYWKDQSWLKTIYVGIIPFILFFFFSKEKSKRRVFIIALMALSLILSLGRYTPVYKYLFHTLPFFNLIRYPVKYLFITIFFLSLAAGFGWDYLNNHIQEPRMKIRAKRFLQVSFFLSLALGLIFLFEKSLISFLTERKWMGESVIGLPSVIHNLKRVIFFSIVSGLWFSLVVNKSWARIIAPQGIIFLLIADLFLGNLGYYVTVDRTVLHSNDEPNLQLILRDREPYRIYVDRRIYNNFHFVSKSSEEYLSLNKELWVPNLLMERNISNITGFSILTLKNYYKILTLITTAPLPDSTRLIDFLNVKYVLWSEPLKNSNYELLRKGVFYLYRNRSCLPRAFLAEGYQVVTDEMKAKQLLQDRQFNFEKLVLLNEPPGEELPKKRAGPIPGIKESVEISEYKNERIGISVSLPRPKFLVLSEAFYPGWKVYLDGRETKIYQANFAFRAVPVPEGTHTVTFVYDPVSIRVGRAITVFTLLTFIFLSISYSLRGQRGKGQKVRD
ncbi:MAG TPA: YfhO family protein [Thermodesulfobacteriota bacterium]|nr:YfhO family protein [Thermodesulfobacteriota bacterium]